MDAIKPQKDSSFAMMLEAMRREWRIFYVPQSKVYYQKHVRAVGSWVRVNDDPNAWFEIGESEDLSLHDFDAVLMRKDPPFDQEYIYTTYMLDHLCPDVFVLNAPQALRDMNEKFATTFFPEFCPETIVTCDVDALKQFCYAQQDIICKPLDTMGGQEVFHVPSDDPNINVILESLSHRGTRTIMAQRYIPEIVNGDKRILLVNGQAIPHVLLRMPQAGEFRGNLAQGASPSTGEFSARDQVICAGIGPRLAVMGLGFVGIDIIGDYLTEINVTSPTGIREIDRLYETNVAQVLFDHIQTNISK